MEKVSYLRVHSGLPKWISSGTFGRIHTDFVSVYVLRLRVLSSLSAPQRSS